MNTKTFKKIESAKDHYTMAMEHFKAVKYLLSKKRKI